MTEITAARQLREKLLADPHRPTYHFAVPEGVAYPFDPNGALFWRGRYHLFYIYQDRELPHDGHSWGHVSSADLLHWRHHPTALAPAPDDPDVGIFSGNGFINHEGVPTLVYYGVRSGICLATAADDELNVWCKSPHNPVIPNAKEDDPFNVFDPHAWVEGDTTYVILGAKVRPKREYDTVYLFRTKDLVHWDYVRQFYEPNPAWTGPEEDCACPDFFGFGDQHMLLCISHARGCRAYLGRYEDERFVPESHHRLNFPGGTCFAPESLLDDRGRRIFWSWALDRRPRDVADASGWSGVMTLPRVLEPASDGGLRITPVEELKQLRHHHRRVGPLEVARQQTLEVTGDRLELALEVSRVPDRCGLLVRRSPDGAEQTVIEFDRAAGRLRIDLARSTLDGSIRYHHYCMIGGDNPPVTEQSAPFELADGEPLRLRVFLDRSILEIFANERLCLTQRLYPTREDSQGIAFFSSGSAWLTLDAWDMDPTNPW